MTYEAFWTAITLTGEPQLILISEPTNDSRHALIVYRVEADKLLVADPNYPGILREIKYDAATGKLSPFNSGDNAAAIATGHEKVYTRFAYVPWQLSSSSEGIAEHWAAMKDGSVGIGRFPANDLEVLVARTDDGQEIWERLDGRLQVRRDGADGPHKGALRLRRRPRPNGRLPWRLHRLLVLGRSGHDPA